MAVPAVSAFDGSYYQAQTLTNPERILNKSEILCFPEERHIFILLFPGAFPQSPDHTNSPISVYTHPILSALSCFVYFIISWMT